MKRKEKRIFIILNEKNLENYNIHLTIQGIDIIRQQMINSVCEIKKGKESGTGIFCKLLYYNKNNEKKFMNTLITNNRVLGENDLYRRKEIFFAWNNKSKEKSLDLDNSRIKFTNKNLDVTIIELKEEDKINCDFLEIDPLIEKEKKN